MMLRDFALAPAVWRGSCGISALVVALEVVLGACGSDSSAGQSALQGDGGAAGASSSMEGSELGGSEADERSGASGQSGGGAGSAAVQDGGADADSEATVADCEPGEVLDDGACVDACSVVACGDHGSCAFDAQAEAAKCECAEGYTGELCAACADGFVDDGDGACVEPCAIFDCGSGTCTSTDGVPSCTCTEPAAGDHCESCIAGYEVVRDETHMQHCELLLPTTEDMLMWLDADDDDSFSLANGSSYVTAWSSLVGTGIDFAPPATTNRPRFDDYPAGTAQSGVRFDGDDDALAESLSLGGSYSVFIVLQVASEMADQTILSGVDGDNAFGFWLRTSNQGGTLQMRHAQGGGTENVTLTGLSLTQRSLIEVHRVGLGLTLISGDASESTTFSATPLPALDFELGRRADAGTFALNGTIHEVIVVAPGVAPNDRAQYRDYLRAKWQLQ